MTIFGSDISHFDAPDTRPMFADGIVFQTHKAGGDRDDAEIGQWWSAVRGHRGQVLLGAYWVLYPGNPAGREDPTAYGRHAGALHTPGRPPGRRRAERYRAVIGRESRSGQASCQVRTAPR